MSDFKKIEKKLKEMSGQLDFGFFLSFDDYEKFIKKYTDQKLEKLGWQILEARPDKIDKDLMFVMLESVNARDESEIHELYHATPKRNWEGIKKHGLLPAPSRFKRNNRPRIYFGKNIEYTKNIAKQFYCEYDENKEPYILMKIDISKIGNIKFYTDIEQPWSAVWTNQKIPREAIKYMTTLNFKCDGKRY